MIKLISLHGHAYWDLGKHAKGVWRGGFWGFRKPLFDSKAISEITYLNKYTIINILASYA